MGWPTKNLADACENLDRTRVPITKSKRVAGDIPYYGASGVVDHVADYLFDEDLLLVSEDGANLLARTYPIAFSISGKTWVNNHAHVLRFPNLVQQHFVEYYLNSISLTPWVTGMAQPKLNQKNLNSIPVPWPLASEQARIVAILDEAFEAIDTAIDNTENNLENARELYDSYLSELFSKRGEGWEQTTLGSIATFNNGINFTKTEKGDSGILTVDVLNMYTDSENVRLDRLYRVNKAIKPHYVLRPGDILFVRSSVSREGVGWPATFSGNPEPVTFCGFIIRARLNEPERFDPSYLTFFLRQPALRSLLVDNAKQATITNVNQAMIAGIPIVVPPLQEQRITAQKEAAYRKYTLRLQAIAEQKITQLKSLKESILEKAFCGELTASAEPMLREASL